MSNRVHIVEVGPRDGLQNEKTPISVADRIAFMRLSAVGSPVSPLSVRASVTTDK